ncbi:MAG: Gfo/Idh/MocA family oxidoreductase [Balneolaceae bacterium]|nr:Gfo/Idh/MocA family oxidoreductase [Balneolaceae bacterium]
MKNQFDRRTFVKSLTLAGAGMALSGPRLLGAAKSAGDEIPVGIIGLDTSHSPAFTRLINMEDDPELSGFRVTAAYPYGSREIESSYSRIPDYIDDVEEMGVEVVDSIEELLDRVEFVMLLTNDGNPRREQAMQVLRAGKTMYMDKPVAASLEDTVAIYDTARELNVPVFSSSSLRYIQAAQDVRYRNKIGDILGVDAFSPSAIEPSHPDLFWYGIHGVEIVFTVMGTGCLSVTRTKTDSTDIVTGTWGDGRLGTFRGIRDGRSGYGGTAFGSEEIISLGTFEGYRPLVESILSFFRSGRPPVDPQETLEIYAFMEAADESKRRNGAAVNLEDVLARARR